MDYLTALENAKPRKPDLPAAEIFLYSHWESKVLEVFLKAYSSDRGKALTVHSNGFGSLLLDLERLVSEEKTHPDVPLVVILDEETLVPGYSLRSDSLLSRERIERSLSEAEELIRRLTAIFLDIAAVRRLVVLPPALPGFPLISVPPFVESSIQKIRSRLHIALLDLQDSQPRRVTILDPAQLWNDLRLSEILDDRLLFSGGWPFSVAATDRMANALWEVIFGAVDSKKLLITDADETLWRGIVGDDGADKISWAQEADTYRFFIYQKTLNLLMSEGVLVALASKNSPESVEAAFKRGDLILNKEGLVCCCASWAPKSEMINNILSETNLLPSSAVFIDDSEFELGEVSAAFPEIRCLKFPDDNSGLRTFLQKIRSSFDTRVVTSEDKNRSQSVKQAAKFKSECHRAGSLEQYLAGLKMQAGIEKIDALKSDRAFQLINKTNQFNLSGRRFDDGAWKALLTAGDHEAYQLRFRDKDADYGIVSVLLMDKQNRVTDWVLSCRVFGRTIEHYMVNFFIRQTGKNGTRPLYFHFKDTGRNQVVRSFLESHASREPGASNNVWKIDCSHPLPSFVSPS
jgi:FkbH-like protein